MALTQHTRLAPGAEALAKMRAAVPLGRMGTKQDVAEMALMLASPLASFITGASIAVDGGVSLLGGRDLSGAWNTAKARDERAETGARKAVSVPRWAIGQCMAADF